MLFDTHCHLDHEKFGDEFDSILDNARAAGVTKMLTIGCAIRRGSAGGARDIAHAHSDWIRASAGVHPHDAAHYDDDIEKELEEVLADPLVLAVGELGLDYYYDNSPREEQQEVMRRQIALAKRVGKPIVIHTRDAREDTLRVLREENARDVGGVIHCFSEDADFAKQALDMNFHASFSGIVTFKNAVAIQEAAQKQPADSIWVETDAPYLAPIPKRGRRNEPAYVAHTASFVAALRGESAESFSRRASENACRTLGWT